MNATNNGTNGTVEGAGAAAVETAGANAAKPAGPCRYCGFEGQHPEPEEPIACIVCEQTHGTAITVRDRRTGEMVERKVLVLHSLGDTGSRDRAAVVREGGRKDDGSFVSPQAPWAAQPICMGCAADLKCATYDARKAAQKDGAKHHELPRWPEFWAFHLAVEEAAHRNHVDAEYAANEEQRRAEAEARRTEKAERDARLARFVSKGYHVPSLERARRSPGRDDGRRGQRNDRGGKRGGARNAGPADGAAHEGPKAAGKPNGVVHHTSTTGAVVATAG